MDRSEKITSTRGESKKHFKKESIKNTVYNTGKNVNICMVGLFLGQYGSSDSTQVIQGPPGPPGLPGPPGTPGK